MRSRLLVLLLPVTTFVILAACGARAERNNAGNSLYEQRQYDAAVDAYEAAQIAAPDAPESYYNAASALAGANELDEAIAALEQALKSADEDLTVKAYYNLGNVYFQQSLFPEAVEAYREVLLRRPDDGDARHNLELALQYILPATATALEQKTEPQEGQTDPSVTPTDNPAGRDGPTPTPPPQEGPPDPSASPVAGQGDVGGEILSTPVPKTGATLTVEDAIELLDVVRQNQQTMREYLQNVSTPGPSSGNDW